MDHAAPDLDLIFAALADPTRRSILTFLLAGERWVGEIAAPHAISLAAVSKHLQVLVRAGLVAQTRLGRSTACRLEPGGLRAAGIWMQGLGGFDPEDYDALEALVETALGALWPAGGELEISEAPMSQLSGRLDQPLRPSEID